MEEKPQSPETMKIVDRMLIFDVDGVITHIGQEKVTEPFILDFIIKILKKREPAAFNTGRGIDWVQEIVLNPLANRISDKSILENLLVVAEGGGIKATFDQNGSINIDVDDSLRMPYDLDQKVRELVEEKYSQSMRYEDKKTMITTKIKEGTSIENYTEEQVKIAEDLQRLIDSYGFTDKFKVDISTIGTSIMHKATGKDMGTELTQKWLKEKGIESQKFVTFGDSLSDLPMAQMLNFQNLPVEFVYVGKENINASAFPFPIHQTRAKFEKGTLEFLKSIA